jgi:hypothetical protein
VQSTPSASSPSAAVSQHSGRVRPMVASAFA